MSFSTERVETTPVEINKRNGTAYGTIKINLHKVMQEEIRNRNEFVVNLDVLSYFLELDEISIVRHPVFLVYQDSCKEKTISEQLREFTGRFYPIE